jgi:hypothetical protein
MTDEEIISIIRRLQSGEIPSEDGGKWIEMLKKETRCPNIAALMFYGDESDTPEDILRKAREYKPFQL